VLVPINLGKSVAVTEPLPANGLEALLLRLCQPFLWGDPSCIVNQCAWISEHGLEYAVIDQSSVASAYAKAHGPLDVLRTGDNPRQVLRDYLRSERETLKLMTNDISANVRLLIAERVPKHDLRCVVNEITRMCKKVARLGFAETLTDAATQTQKHNGGVRA